MKLLYILSALLSLYAVNAESSLGVITTVETIDGVASTVEYTIVGETTLDPNESEDAWGYYPILGQAMKNPKQFENLMNDLLNDQESEYAKRLNEIMQAEGMPSISL